MDDAEYTAGRAQLGPGDALLLISDGFTEAASPDGTLFDDTGIEQWLADPPEELAPLVAIVRAHEAGGPASDDMAALLLRVHSYKT